MVLKNRVGRRAGGELAGPRTSSERHLWPRPSWTPKRQAAFAELTNYAPGNTDVAPDISAKTLANLPTAAKDRVKVSETDVKANALEYDAALAQVRCRVRPRPATVPTRQ